MKWGIDRRVLAAAAFAVLLGGPVAAQGTGSAAGGSDPAAAPAVADAQALPGRVVETGTKTDRADEGRWTLNAGWESDDRGTDYGFAGPQYSHPIGDRTRLEARLYATYLAYEYDESGGRRTRVSGPGLSPAVGLRFGNRNWVAAHVGVGIQAREETLTGPDGLEQSADDTYVGPSVGVSAWWNTSRRSNIHAMFNYGAASDYSWGRIAGRHQVTNYDWRGPVALYLGAEIVGQGNEDIRSLQVGPMLEAAISGHDLSFTARAGYKRSSFDVGEDESGPYFGLGVWKRF